MKRAVVTLVAIVATGLAAGTADAAVKKGKFTGKTAQDDPIGVKVDKRQRVHSFFFDGVTLKCTDGDTVDTPTGADRIQTDASERFPIEQRRWGIRARAKDKSFGWDVAGRFSRSGKKTTGTLSIFALFNEQGHQDPNGSVRCQVKNLEFTLRRR